MSTHLFQLMSKVFIGIQNKIVLIQISLTYDTILALLMLIFASHSPISSVTMVTPLDGIPPWSTSSSQTAMVTPLDGIPPWSTSSSQTAMVTPLV